MGTVGHTSGSQTHQGQGEMAARGTGAVGVSKSSGVSGKESEGATGREGSASTSSAGDEKGLWDDDGPFDTAVASAASRVQAFMRAPAASPLCPAADTAMRAAIGLCAAAGCIITNESSAPLSAVLGLASTCVAMVQVLAACVYLWQVGSVTSAHTHAHTRARTHTHTRGNSMPGAQGCSARYCGTVLM